MNIPELDAFFQMEGGEIPLDQQRLVIGPIKVKRNGRWVTLKPAKEKA